MFMIVNILELDLFSTRNGKKSYELKPVCVFQLLLVNYKF